MANVIQLLVLHVLFIAQNKLVVLFSLSEKVRES